MKRKHQDTVVHDLAAAHVDAVVGKAETGRNEVRAQRWLFVSRQKPIPSAKSGETAAVAHRHGDIARATLLVRVGTMES